MRWRRLVAVLTIGLLLALASTPSARADDYLMGSDPQPRQELKEAPGWVTLAFASRATAKLAKVLVLNSSGKNVTTGALIVEGTNVTTQLDDGLPRGTYSVYYRTSGSDGKPRGGAFQFSYGSGQWTPLDAEVWVGEQEEPPILKNPDPNETGPGTAPPATRTPSPTVTATAAPSAEPEPSPGETPAEVPAAPEAQEGNSATGWLVAAGIVVLGLAGWGAVLYARRNRAGG